MTVAKFRGHPYVILAPWTTVQNIPWD